MRLNTLLFLLFCFIYCHSQSIKLFTADRELSSSLINKVYQDKNGLIWIATEDGLNRYDGAKFITYKNDPDKENTLRHNFIRNLFEDNKGNLLIGTYNGVQMYLPSKDCFSKPALRENGTHFYSNIGMMLQRKNGDILISGNELSILSIKDEELIIKPINLPVPIIITDFILEDKNENLWVVKDENKIFSFDTSGNYKEYSIEKDEIIITALGQDFYGNIFVGTIANGLFRFDKNTDRFIPILYNGKETNFSIKSLYQANQDEIYIGTDGDGMKIYNCRTSTIFDNRLNNSYFDLSESKVHNIMKDNSGNFWISIFQKGVMMIPAQTNNFKYIGHKSIDKNIIGSCAVTSLLRDHKGVLWISTDNDGLYGITDQGEKKAHFKSTGKSSTPNIIMNLYEDSDHNLWFGSFTRGMGKIDRNTGICTYLNDLTDCNGKRIPRVYNIVEDNYKRLWIATMGGGLFYYDMLTGKTVQPDYIKTDKWISYLFYIENKLSIGTYDGICCVDMSGRDLKCESELSKNIIHTIYKSRSRKEVWLGTSDGLVAWNQSDKTIEKFTTKDGLPSNVIFAIEEDSNNNLWISSNAGISQFNPENKKIINFFVGDGLQGNEFSKNASYKDKNGNLWFGGMNGITYFNPQEIISPAKKWNVHITDFYLHNTPVRAGMKSGSKEIITTSVFEAKEFNLSAKDNSFTIEFATKEFNSPERIAYTYSIDNADWVYLRPGINRVSFTNITPGNHRFRFRAIDYNMMSDTAEIMIKISPAWYNSTLARIIYFILFLIFLYLIYIQKKHREEVNLKMLQHIHAEEINEAKLQFFINISHEIRTPMSLIISPLQQLMVNDSDAGRQRMYKVMYRNSDRILNLINQLMDLRKIDKGQMCLKFQETDIVSFISNLFSTFESQAQSKHINMNFTSEKEQIFSWIDPANFDKIIMNILSNAFKFTPENGNISINVSCDNRDQNKGYAKIQINDTGIGIKEEEQDRIFERFYQIRNNVNNSNVGTGIGLHLTRSLVELHHGTVSSQKNIDGPGSCFIIRIPLGNTHLSSDEMVTDAQIQEKRYHKEKIFINEEEENTDKTKKSKNKQHIVIVEDDDEIRNYLALELSSDYHITAYCNGKEAISSILKNTPSLVISDVMMPEMDGLTLCRKIKQNVNINHIPVILLTAKTQDEDNLDCLNVGADSYLTKPFNIDIVRKTVDNMIKSREILRNCFSGNQEQEVKKPIFEMQSSDNKLLDKIMNVINRNLSNPDLNVEMITSEVGISRVHLHRKLKELTNQSTRDLIRNVRLKQAAQLLENTDYNISEISDLTGFSSITIFSRSFKDLYGVTPSEYASQKARKPFYSKEIEEC